MRQLQYRFKLNGDTFFYSLAGTTVFVYDDERELILQAILAYGETPETCAIRQLVEFEAKLDNLKL